jgi:hypothetical protein
MTLEHGAEPVIGWRVWNLSDDDTAGPVLWPAGSGADPWPRRRPLEARCTVPRVLTWARGRHEAPALGCRCGIHASDSLEVVARERPAWLPAPVIGRVALWGRTIAHERGWRAALAYPDRLRLVCVVCAWIEPGPGVPTVVHVFGDRRYTLCDEHAAGLELPGGRRTRSTAGDARALQSRLLEAYAVDLLPGEPLEPLYRREPAEQVPAFFPSIRLVPRSAADDDHGRP